MAKGNLTIGWVDPGHVESEFMSGVLNLVNHLIQRKIELAGMIHYVGNYIYKQRQELWDDWVSSDSDWILWLDSDIVITPEQFDYLWDSADKDHPIVSGIYFITMQPNQPLMMPAPCIFYRNEQGTFDFVQQIPDTPELMKVDAAGFGCVLIHKSVVPLLKEKYPSGIMFDVSVTPDRQYTGEDISFFKKCLDAEIPVHAHTGAQVAHIKRFVFDKNYSNLWWNVVAPEIEKKLDSQK